MRSIDDSMMSGVLQQTLRSALRPMVVTLFFCSSFVLAQDFSVLLAQGVPKRAVGQTFEPVASANDSEGAERFPKMVLTEKILYEFLLAEIKIDGKSYRCILKDIQFDKVSDALIHLDFLELVDNKKVIATLPIKFTGTPAGVKAGGKLVTKMKTLKIKALPKDLRENIEVDLSNLELNGNVRVEDVKAENIEILNSPRIPIASVTMTRQLKQEEASAPKAAAAAPAAAAKK